MVVQELDMVKVLKDRAEKLFMLYNLHKYVRIR